MNEESGNRRAKSGNGDLLEGHCKSAWEMGQCSESTATELDGARYFNV
jgi:hypothetical protein